MKKVLHTVIILGLFNLAGCLDNCKNTPKNYDVQGFKTSIRQISEVYPDHSVRLSPLDSTMKIDFDKFVIELEAELVFYGCSRKEENFDFSSFFINSAMATECAEPGYHGSTEQISEISIFSSYPFFSSGTPGDNLCRHFKVSVYRYQWTFSDPMDLDSLVSTHPHPPKIIRLLLKEKPTGSSKHKFTIQYTQSNGESYTLTSPTVEFNEK